MKLTTKSRYGALAMVDLAKHFGEGPIKIREISKRQDISEYYLQQILSSLSKANLVNSTAGSQGGFALARLPENITLLDILEVLEGNLCLVPCVDAPAHCEQTKCCNIHGVWGLAAERLKETFREINLKQLCEMEGKPV